MANTQYRKNLLDLAQASKTYTDKVAQEILWKIGEYDITTQSDNTTALVKTAPSGATRVKIKRISGNCVKYAPSTASDDSVAKDKVIPENTYTTELNTLGAMSYKSENLCPTATYNDIMNNTIAKSIDLGNLAPGTYTISFNVIANADNRTFILYYVNNGVVDTNNSVNTGLKGTGAKSFTFTVDNSIDYDDIILGINTGTLSYSIELNNLMLNTGSTALPYQPYFDGIRDAAVTSAVLIGNLLNIADVAETTVNGITYKIENGIIYINGTATQDTTIYLIVNIPSGTYSFSSFSSKNIQFRKSGAYIGAWASFSARTFNDGIDQISIYYTNGTTITDNIIKPMLVKGSSVPTIFKPYIAPITKTIPQEIQALEGYGWGINDTCYNYIDFVNKKFIQKVVRYTFTGNETITKTSTVSGGGYRFNVSIPYTIIEASAIMSNTLEYQTQTQMYNTGRADYGIAFRNANAVYIYVVELANSEISDMREWLINNPTTIYIELATPIETDISSYLPTDFNKIATNDNYTNIEFVSEYGYDIPNKVSYYGTIKETLCTAINKNNALAISLTNNEAKYGWSVNNFYNTRDYTTNKGSQKANRIVVDSNTRFSWIPASFGSCTITPNPRARKGGDVQYLWISNNANIANITGEANGGIYITFKQAYSSADELKASLIGTIIYYPLGEEVIEDITSLENNVIEVVENDELKFVNSENQAVPSEITYRIEVEK